MDTISILVIVAIIALFIYSAIKILQEYERGVIFFLGRFWKVKGPGLIIWKIHPRDTEINRPMVMDSIERMVRENNGTFLKKGDMFIEPEKGEPVSPVAAT